MSSIEKTNINLNIGKMNNLIKPKLFYIFGAPILFSPIIVRRGLSNPSYQLIYILYFP